jgi:peptidase E
MQEDAVRAVLFGGGGITNGCDPELDVFLMACLPDAPRIGYLGTANGDDPRRLARVMMRFQALGADVRHLPRQASAAGAQAWADELDAVYVGGGQTADMLDHWRETGLDTLLRASALRGVVLSGVSAGAVCWFEQALWDGGGARYQPLTGLGLFPGSCCPHFTTEPARAAAYREHLADGRIAGGYAIGDGAGLVLADKREPSAIVARTGSGVWRADGVEGDSRLVALPLVW